MEVYNGYDPKDYEKVTYLIPKDEKDYTKEEVAEWRKVRDKLKELDITIRNINRRFNENKGLRKEISLLYKRINELEKENTKLRNHIDMFSEEEYCD